MKLLKEKLLALGKFVSENPEFYNCYALVDGWEVRWQRYHEAYELSITYRIHYKPTPHRPHGASREGYQHSYQSTDTSKLFVAAIEDLPEQPPTKAPRNSSVFKNLDGLEFHPDLLPWDEEPE